MKKIGLQTTVSILIAVLTTVITTAFTRYLLGRPWCIQLESAIGQRVLDHRILYGSNRCAPGSGDSPQRLAAQEKVFDPNVYSEYVRSEYQ